MIIELAGLPGAGKTTLAEALRKEGVISIPTPTRFRLFVDAGLFWLSHPVLACKLLAYILWRSSHGARYLLFMNGYVGYAARYRSAKARSRTGALVVLDQGFSQLCISLQGLPLAFVALFPKPDMLVVVTTDDATRERRMTHRGWSAREKFSEAMLRTMLSTFEKAVHVYEYDGTQNPEEGAARLMTHLKKQSRPFVQTTSRNVLKTTVAAIAFLIAQLEHLFSRTSQVAVLMYHTVSYSPWKLAVSPEVFERQMEYLARKGWAVPLADVVLYAKGEKKLPAHAIAVTFDDGYHDVFKIALPILERYRIPVTVFIPSDFSIQTNPNDTRRLSEEEVRTLSQSPLVTIGSHAKTHRKFTELSLEEIENELVESAKVLASVIGKRPQFFAYPFGVRSASAERAVKAAGYEVAFGITEGTIHQGDNLFRLKRVQIDSTMNFFLFRLRLTAAVDWNRRIVDWLRRP